MVGFSKGCNTPGVGSTNGGSTKCFKIISLLSLV